MTDQQTQAIRAAAEDICEECNLHLINEKPIVEVLTTHLSPLFAELKAKNDALFASLQYANRKVPLIDHEAAKKLAVQTARITELEKDLAEARRHEKVLKWLEEHEECTQVRNSNGVKIWSGKRGGYVVAQESPTLLTALEAAIAEVGGK